MKASDESLLEYEDNEFRYWQTEECSGPHGTVVRLRRCEELIGGKWEGFVAIKGWRYSNETEWRKGGPRRR